MLNPTPVNGTHASPDIAPIVRVAICGEVNSGKSTIINAIARENLLPEGMGRAIRPVIEVHHASEAATEAHYADGRIDKDFDLHKPAGSAGSAKVVVRHPGKTLAGMELVEVPVAKAEQITEADLDLIASCDVIVWVTIASQAWRLTEKSIVETFGARRPSRGIIAVSRADKLRSDADRDRLKARILSETDAFFSDCILISGSRRLIANSAQRDDAWAATRGPDLTAALGGLIEEVRADAMPPQDTPEAGADQDERTSAEILSLEQFRLINTDTATEQEAAGEDTDAPDVGEHPLRGIASTFFGASAIGLATGDAADPVIPLNGDTDLCRGVAEACAAAKQALVTAYASAGIDGELQSIALTSRGGDQLHQSFAPDDEILFLLSVSNRMSPGIARTAMARLSHARGAGA